jgi:NACHT domain
MKLPGGPDPATRRAIWRIAFITIAVAIGTTSLGHAIAHFLPPGLAQTLVAALVGISPPALYLTLATFRLSMARNLNLDQVADALAVKVGTQWEAEAGPLRLNDPYPLPVAWVAAADDLFDPWEDIARIAAFGLGWPRPHRKSLQEPGQLAGGELADKLDRIPTRRLVVLGGAGTGKTVLMIRLVIDLLARRDKGGPVPILLSAASWDPDSQSLRDWLASRMAIEYSELTEPAPPGTQGSTRLEALLREHRITLILDGLDEIAPGQHSAAIDSINEAGPLGAQMVVTCRTAAYREAVRPQHMRGAAGVELLPLDPGEVREYLRAAAGPDADRWSPVMAVLGTSHPAGLALQRPLTVSLACAIFNRRRGENINLLPAPAELCDPALGDEAAVNQYLFGAFIPAAYRRASDRPALRIHPWRATQAQRYLGFLARHLLPEVPGRTDIGWWELGPSIPKKTRTAIWSATLLGAMAIGAVVGGLGAANRTGGFSVGAAVGLTVALLVRSEDPPRWPRPRWLAGMPSGGLAPGIAAGALGGLIGGTLGGLIGGLASGIVVGIAIGVFIGPTGGEVGGFAGGAAGGFAGGLVSQANWGIPGGIADGIAAAAAVGIAVSVSSKHDPAQRLRWWWPGILSGLAVGLAGGILAGLTSTAVIGIVFGVLAGLAGVIAGGLGVVPADLTAASDPRAVLTRDRRTFLIVGLTTWVLVGLVARFMTSLEPGLSRGAINAIVAAGIGLGAGLAAASTQAVWGFFVVTRCWLATRRQLPWRLMGFLADAYQKGVLRQNGPYYQFRHPELRDYLDKTS